jgi:hypothetical protein
MTDSMDLTSIMLERVREDISRGIDPPMGLIGNLLTDLDYERRSQQSHIEAQAEELRRMRETLERIAHPGRYAIYPSPEAVNDPKETLKWIMAEARAALSQSPPLRGAGMIEFLIGVGIGTAIVLAMVAAFYIGKNEAQIEENDRRIKALENQLPPSEERN